VSGSGWWDILKRTWTEAGEENLGLIASGIAFNAFLAFVPLLTAVVLTYGLVAAPEQVARHIATLSGTMPQEAAGLIGNQLQSMVETAGSTAGFGLLISLAIALYGAMRGASGIITGLNIVFDIDESRSFLRQTGMALAITFGLVLVFIVASLGISVLGFLEDLLPALGGVVHIVLQIAFWLAAAAFVSFVIALIYRYAPNRPETEWRWLTPGSAVATIVWVAATFAFAFYVRNFGSYNATYGALGAVIIFLTWLYLSSYILLLGAELNQVLERRVGREKALGGADKAAEAERKSSGRKLHGERQSAPPE
ncbi:MAG TPA: YihY/virulence factor BrkB family protein, partial [Chloroflexota bacterium]|nr:YihY/virulence factor BrkB family protein [Chloroflexota bacterium]